MTSDLIPIDTIVGNRSLSRLGDSDRRVHLAYLTKIGLLPQTVRRKINGQISGCYPRSVLALLPRIESLKNQGMTYSQMKYYLSKCPDPKLANDSLPITPYPSPLIFILIGFLLGYLLAVTSTFGQKSPTNLSVLASNLPLDNSTPALVRLVPTGPKNNLIYIISLPQSSNLETKINKINLTDLNSQ